MRRLLSIKANGAKHSNLIILYLPLSNNLVSVGVSWSNIVTEIKFKKRNNIYSIEMCYIFGTFDLFQRKSREKDIVWSWDWDAMLCNHRLAEWDCIGLAISCTRFLDANLLKIFMLQTLMILSPTKKNPGKSLHLKLMNRVPM